MGCLVILLALISPRFALVVLWLFTDEVSTAYDNPWIPVLGFVFLPWTTFMYALAWAPGGPSALGWVFVALALLADLSSWARSLDRRATRRGAY
jgi:hypothetical protein